MKKNKEEKSIALNSGNDKKTKIDDRKEVQEFILHLTEERVQQRGTDKNLDRDNQIRFILKGVEVSVSEVKKNVQNQARPYSPMFPVVYFRLIYKLLGFPVEEADQYFRRREVAIFTREVIYGCFDKGVLMSFHVLNPYTGYMSRNFKHFQFMTDEGIEKLASIITNAIELMSKCTTMIEFRKEWLENYGVSYQANLFA